MADLAEASDYTTEHKAPTYRVQRLRNTDPEFYSLLGPLLSRREIVGELGSPVWDDNDKTWLLAVDDGGVLGMVALRAGREVCSLYVTPGNRGKLVGYALLHNLTQHAGPGALTATATETSRGLFELFGFKQVGTRGRYYLLKKEVR